MNIDYLEKFNDTFKEFIDDLILEYPDDPDFGLYKIGTYTALSNDEFFIVNMFNFYVTSIYGDQILNKDEEFFLNHEMSNNCIDNNAMNIIHKIQVYWVEMADSVKAVIWKYFRVLILLDRKYRTHIEN
jgi:hypothetical protein